MKVKDYKTNQYANLCRFSQHMSKTPNFTHGSLVQEQQKGNELTGYAWCLNGISTMTHH